MAGEVVAERETVRRGDRGGATDSAAHQGVAVEQSHRGGSAARQLPGAVSDALHDRLEVEAHRGQLVLHRDDRAQNRDV